MKKDLKIWLGYMPIASKSQLSGQPRDTRSESHVCTDKSERSSVQMLTLPNVSTLQPALLITRMDVSALHVWHPLLSRQWTLVRRSHAIFGCRAKKFMNFWKYRCLLLTHRPPQMPIIPPYLAVLKEIKESRGSQDNHQPSKLQPVTIIYIYIYNSKFYWYL